MKSALLAVVVVMASGLLASTLLRNGTESDGPKLEPAVPAAPQPPFATMTPTEVELRIGWVVYRKTIKWPGVPAAGHNFQLPDRGTRQLDGTTTRVVAISLRADAPERLHVELQALEPRHHSRRLRVSVARRNSLGQLEHMTFLDRQRGCLLGLAVGDALGAAVEFMDPGTFPPVTGYRAGGPHGLNPGEWTDDTSMALALADSIANAGWDLNDQACRYVEWWRKGAYSVNGRCFDIGNTVRSALARFEKTRDSRTSASRSPDQSGNGSIMRLAPAEWTDDTSITLPLADSVAMAG